MKQEKKSVQDFPHQITFQMTKEDYLEYSQVQSKPQWEKSKKKALFFAVFCGILGVLALGRGLLKPGEWSQLYIVGGILLLAYQVINLFYTYLLFPGALKKSVIKELEKDERLTKEITLCFEPDKIISFSRGAHQATFFAEDFRGRQETEHTIILILRNGKNVVIPKRAAEQGDQQVKEALAAAGTAQ